MTAIDNELTAGAERVFLWTGNVIHLIDPKMPPGPNEVYERRVAVCGFRPYWPGVWFPGDHERAANMDFCGRCLYTLGAYASVE